MIIIHRPWKGRPLRVWRAVPSPRGARHGLRSRLRWSWARSMGSRILIHFRHCMALLETTQTTGVDDLYQEWQCQYFVTVEDPPYSCRVHLRVVKTWHHAATPLLVRRKQLGNYQKIHQNWLKGYQHSKTWPNTLKLNPLTSLPYGKRCKTLTSQPYGPMESTAKLDHKWVLTLNLSFPCPETLQINCKTTQKPNLPNPTHKNYNLTLSHPCLWEALQTLNCNKQKITKNTQFLLVTKFLLVLYPPRCPNISPPGPDSMTSIFSGEQKPQVYWSSRTSFWEGKWMQFSTFNHQTFLRGKLVHKP